MPLSPDAVLTDRQERFVCEYLVDLNARAAARRAGYSSTTQGARAAALLRDPLVSEAVAIRIRELRERLGLSPMDVWRGLAAVAFFDVRGVIDRNGQMIPIQDVDEESAAALSVSCRVLKSGETLMNVGQASRLSALLALEKRLAREHELERKALAEEDARQAAEDLRVVQERLRKRPAALAGVESGPRADLEAPHQASPEQPEPPSVPAAWPGERPRSAGRQSFCRVMGRKCRETQFFVRKQGPKLRQTQSFVRVNRPNSLARAGPAGGLIAPISRRTGPVSGAGPPRPPKLLYHSG